MEGACSHIDWFLLMRFERRSRPGRRALAYGGKRIICRYGFVPPMTRSEPRPHFFVRPGGCDPLFHHLGILYPPALGAGDG